MISSLQIKNFKKIETLKLSSLDKVNFFIGENGSGKSSLIEFMSFMLGHVKGQNLEKYFTEVYGNIEMFSGKDGTLSLSYTDGRKDKGVVRVVGSKIEAIESIEHNDINADYYNPATINPHTLVPHNPHGIPKLNDDSTLDDIATDNRTNLYEVKDPRIDSFFNDILGIPKEDIISEKIRNFNQLSTGYKNLLHQFLNIYNFLSDGIRREDSWDRVFVYLLEEPEYALHANFQKYIPKIINYFDKYPIQFFISTHSSVLINKAKLYPRSKVWFLENGSTVPLKGMDGNGGNGYLVNAKESVAFSASLMGIETEDIGYPENFCLVEEASIIKLFDKIMNSDKNFLKTLFFVSVGGEAGFEKYGKDELRSFKSQDTLIKCNPFYDDSYLLIVDNYHEKEGRFVDYLDKRKEVLNEDSQKKRFIELSKPDLENYYEDYYENDTKLKKIIEPKMKELFKAISNKKMKEEKGKLKLELAECVGQFIIDSDNPKEMFSKIFNKELDLLIKST